MEQNKKYSQGVYAGPLTQRATDYDGHEVIGVPISDVYEDGHMLFVTLDEHLQVSIAPVLASSIRSWDPESIPDYPECTDEELLDTKRNLEWLLNRELERGEFGIIELYNCSSVMHDLAIVTELLDARKEKESKQP